MANGDVIIFTALDFEAQPIARRLGLRFVNRTAAVGELSGGETVRLYIVGPQAKHLPSEIATVSCNAVIMAGVAGGLSDELRLGDVVVDEASDVKGDVRCRRAGIATVNVMASTPAEKRTLQRSTGAVAVDMENAIARDWARRQGIPFLGLRAISDTSSQTLDPATLRIVDDAGFLRVGRLLREVIRRPAFIRSLWQLRSSRTAVEALAANVHEWVTALTASGRG